MKETGVSDAMGQTEWIEVRRSPIHGMGAFARADIPAGTAIIEYRGEKISKAESNLRCEQGNEFIFALDDEHDVDGAVDWNWARWINHSCAPNCDAEYERGGIWIVARRAIQAGEEIAFNYGYDLEDYRDHPCRCGALECVGVMVAEEFYSHVRANRGEMEGKGH